MIKLSPFGVEDLDAYLQREGIAGEMMILTSPTPTVETAANALGVEPDQIVKSILFMINENPVLALGCGLDLIDRRLIGKHFQVGRKKVKMADAEAVIKYCGYPIGTVPPIGHRQPILTLMDEKILAHEVVYVGGGADNAMLKMKAMDVQIYANATVLNLSSPKKPTQGK